MKTLTVALMLSIGVGMALSLPAAELPAAIKLPSPQLDQGCSLMQALKNRQSRRELRDEKLPVQELANLFWAACGINRAESGKRTAPSAVNWQEIEVYAALPEGLFRYDPKAAQLTAVLAEDIRPAAGKQVFVQTAPIVLIYVADYARMTRGSEADKAFYAATDTGFISQNVYLYCASANLATTVIGMVDKPALAAKMNLRPEQKVILVQPVGHPKK